jgi:hypothetical protein
MHHRLTSFGEVKKVCGMCGHLEMQRRSEGGRVRLEASREERRDGVRVSRVRPWLAWSAVSQKHSGSLSRGDDGTRSLMVENEGGQMPDQNRGPPKVYMRWPRGGWLRALYCTRR